MPSAQLSDSLIKRLQLVKLIVSDVDGVLAKGILIAGDGMEIKWFCEKDRPRIDMVQSVGIPFVMISGRNSKAVRIRADEMKVTFYNRKEMGATASDQLSFLEGKYNVVRGEVLYIGDDTGDLWWFEHVGCAAAPSDADEEALHRAHLVAEAKGGEGAVSEILKCLLRAQGKYEKALGPRLVSG